MVNSNERNFVPYNSEKKSTTMISEINIQETSPLFKPNWINHNVMLCFRGEFSNGKIKKKKSTEWREQC